MAYHRMEAKPIAGEHGRFCGDAKAPLVKTPCCQQWICCDTAFLCFEAADDAKLSTSVLACAIPTMRIGMGARGKAARNAEISGHHEIINSTPRTLSIGPDFDAWEGGHEAISARISCHVLKRSGILHGFTMSPSPTGDPDHAVAPHEC
jgi:hypothetical protein